MNTSDLFGRPAATWTSEPISEDDAWEIARLLISATVMFSLSLLCWAGA